MTQEDLEKSAYPADNRWLLSVSDTARRIADALGESPEAWQQRLTNWRKGDRVPGLQHHQQPGKRPHYLVQEVDDFINGRLIARTPYSGNTPEHARTKVVADQLGIALEWATHAASGRFRLNREEARKLGVQLTALADRYEHKAQDK